MARRLRVYGWMGLRPNEGFEVPPSEAHRRQARCIVAATSKAEVARICGRPTFSEANFLNLCETGNATEIEVATARPGVVFLLDDFNYTPGEKVYVEHPNPSYA